MIRKTITFILICALTISFSTPCMAADIVSADIATGQTLAQVGDTKVVHLGMNLRTITVPNGKGQLISLPSGCKTVSVGNPLICDVVMLGTKDFLLVGKSPGETNVYVWLENDMKLESTIKVFDSTKGLVKLIEEILPYEKDITVSMAHNTVILSGYVMKPTSIEGAQKIAEAYMAGRESTASIDVKVVNMLKVKDEKQIMLEVRFAEVVRTSNADMGMDWRYTGDFFGAPSDFSFLEGGSPAYHAGTSGGLAIPSQNGSQGTSINSIGWDGGSNTMTYGFDWLEAQGLGKIIAKPNLLVRNGEEASFLAGGEFPVPVQEEDAVQIEWKEFGVKLTFTPVIDERENIHLEMIPEVSVLDFSEAAVSVNGFNIPALKTRRTETKVVLRDGESFYISGLISQSETDSFSKVPGIDTIPILGHLFRKKEDTLSETELIVFVTPRIINPVKADIKKEYNDPEKMRLMTNTIPVPFEQAHGDEIKTYIEQGEKPEKSLETLREEEIAAELARLEAERLKAIEEEKQAEEAAKQAKKQAKEDTKKAKKLAREKEKMEKDDTDIEIVEKTIFTDEGEEKVTTFQLKDGSPVDLSEDQPKKKKSFWSAFSFIRAREQKKALEQAEEKTEQTDILAENADDVDIEEVYVAKIDENVSDAGTITIASSEDITASVDQGSTYFDDISDELHELSALKG